MFLMTIAILANVTSCVAAYLVTRRIWWGPIFGTAAQSFWFVYAWALGAPGWPLFIPAVWFGYCYASSIRPWVREHHQLKKET